MVKNIGFSHKMPPSPYCVTRPQWVKYPYLKQYSAYIFCKFCILYINSDGSLGLTSVLTPNDVTVTSDAEVAQKIRQIPDSKFTLPGGKEVSFKDGIFYAEKAGETIAIGTYKKFILQNMHKFCVELLSSYTSVHQGVLWFGYPHF